MTLSVRISRTGNVQPQGGFLGALVGGTVPGETLDIVIESDEFSSTQEATDFLQPATAAAAKAYNEVILGQIVEAEVVETDFEDPEFVSAVLTIVDQREAERAEAKRADDEGDTTEGTPPEESAGDYDLPDGF